MLTPVDIQQKKFRIGLGYEKKEVNDFVKDVLKDYESLYKTNAQLQNEVSTLSDSLQHYKNKEASLNKSLMLAEKDSEDKKSKAVKEAKTIELEARNKAKSIIGDAEERLVQIQNEIAELQTKYALYKSNFCSLMKQQFEFLKENDFDVDAYIDERFVTLAAAPKEEKAFGSFDGDPQMRDESTLGGMSGGGFGSGAEDKNSTSSVYTANLSAGENFVDPFNPTKKNDRFNEFEPVEKKDPAKKPSFTVKDGQKAKTTVSKAKIAAAKAENNN